MKKNNKKVTKKASKKEEYKPFTDVIPEKFYPELPKNEHFDNTTKFSDALDAILSIKQISEEVEPFDLSYFLNINEKDLLHSKINNYVFNKENCIELDCLTATNNPLYVKITRQESYCIITTKYNNIDLCITSKNNEEVFEKINHLFECLSHVLLKKLSI